MQNFKIIVSYDGTDFFGWQIQPVHITVTSVLQNTFKMTFGREVGIVGASRTDSGVHALGQVAVFSTDLKLNAAQILYAWNNALPRSILIRSIESIPMYINPCSNVLQKTYYYALFLKQPSPFISRFGWYYRSVDSVDWGKFNQALGFYLGEHDFGSFCKISPDEDKSPVRKIDSINLKKISRFDAYLVTIKGKSFLRFQIRRMIGYALDVARRKDLSVDFIQSILDNPNPEQTLVKADGCGLCLGKVVYNENISIQRRIF